MVTLFLFLNAQNNNNFLKLRFRNKKSLVINKGFFVYDICPRRTWTQLISAGGIAEIFGYI